MPQKNQKIETVYQLVESAEKSLLSAKKLLSEFVGVRDNGQTENIDVYSKAHDVGSVSIAEEGSRVVEGVFDGVNMVGPDGKLYSVPANYASKSKLVEGDTMKLTIQPNGEFIYKQIGPIERERMVGVLQRDEETAEYLALAGGHEYRVLQASVTYFRGSVGDEVVILAPKGGQSKWAAVENIIKVKVGESQEIHEEAKKENEEKNSVEAKDEDDLDEL